MSARIVAQIDVLLARLIAARDILASLVAVEPIAQPGRVVTMEARQPAETAEPATPVLVTVVKPRERRERRTITRTASAAAASALAGSIPQHPVAVSPRQLAEARETRAPERPDEAATAAPRSALDELMMEVAQRSA